jgi:hypothetical protein
MVSHPELSCIERHDARNTARVTMHNPRNGHQSCVDVYAHPADVADAVILFAHHQCICPTEVEMSTVWPEGDGPRQSRRRAPAREARTDMGPRAA